MLGVPGDRAFSALDEGAAVNERLERAVLSRWARHDDRMRTFERTKSARSLYASTWEQSIAAVIRADVARELGFAPEEPTPAPAELGASDPFAGDESGGLTERCECGAWDVRLFSGEAGWACESCRKARTVVWGCVVCARVVCDDCIRRVARRQYASGVETLDACARYFRCSRERVRQIEVGALRKLAALGMRGFLLELLSGEPPLLRPLALLDLPPRVEAPKPKPSPKPRRKSVPSPKPRRASLFSGDLVAALHELIAIGENAWLVASLEGCLSYADRERLHRPFRERLVTALSVRANQ